MVLLGGPGKIPSQILNAFLDQRTNVLPCAYYVHTQNDFEEAWYM